MPTVGSVKKRNNFYSVSFLFAIIIGHSTLLAQGSGAIKGLIRDAENGNPLPGASVLIQGTSLGAATDLDGEFIIHNAPAENITLKISYLGYVTAIRDVTVIDGEQLKVDIGLTPQTLEGETVVVTAQAQGQMQAINQQLSSNKIVNVVSESKIQELPDFNAAEAIGRLPGIATLRSSGEATKVIVRGIAPQYNLIAVEGINMSATGSSPGVQINPGSYQQPYQDRSTDITMITPNMLQAIEVNKTFTPDMDGDAIGGFVNMKLREAPSGFQTDLMWQSGYVKKNSKYGNYKALASISDRFLDDMLGFYLLGNIEGYDRSDDRFNASYSKKRDLPGAEFNPVVVNSFSLNRHIETRNRYGANLILDYRLPGGSLKAINMFSRLNSDYRDYTTNQDHTGKNLNFNLRYGIGNNDVATNALQSEYDLGFLSVDAGVANSYSRNYDPHQRSFTFVNQGAIPTNPAENAPPEALVQNVNYNDSITYLQFLADGRYQFKENGQTYSANIKIPFNIASSISGYFKTGGKYRNTHRSNDQDLPYAQVFYGGSRTFVDEIGSRFPGLQRDSSISPLRFYSWNFSHPDQSISRDFLGNKFGNLFWVPASQTLESMLTYIEDSPSLIDPLGAGWLPGPAQVLINDYEMTEKFYATYFMTELNLWNYLTIVGGVRYEEMTMDFDAYRMQNTGYPLSQPYTKEPSHSGNHYWLPMVQVKFNLIEWADLRYAYTKTLARPDFSANSPYANSSSDGRYINAGNPDLQPAVSINNDVMLTFHNDKIGLFSAGAFFKTINNFTYSTSYNLMDDSLTLPGFKYERDFFDLGGRARTSQLSTTVNNPFKATLKGIEGEWQSPRFWYLPFPFDGMVFSFNYTHIWSETKYVWVFQRNIIIPPGTPGFPRGGSYPINVDTSRTGRLLNQPSDIVNASIGYDYKGFSGRISFMYQDQIVTGISPNVPESDSFTEPYFRTDLSVRQKLPITGLELFCNVNNINERADISTQRSIGGFTSENFYGLTADLGIRLKF